MIDPGSALLLDTMIAHALTVAQAAGRLATPVRVLRRARPDPIPLMALAALTAVAALLTGCAAVPSMARKTTVVRCGDATHTVSATGALSGVAADGALAVVPFAEGDAAALRPGEPVSVTVDAVSGAGQTARVVVTTVLARDAQLVSNAAVIRDRDASYVDLVGPNGQVTRDPVRARTGV